MASSLARVGGQESTAKLHPSTATHLDIELTVLDKLIERSKFQHRSQPFLQRMREVYRLGERVRRSLEIEKDQEAEIAKRLKALLPRFVQALMKAAVSTQQIIQLEHFLPTHIPVLAVYGRLFALASHLGQNHTLDMEELLGTGAQVPSKVKTSKSVLDPPSTSSLGLADATDLDLGQKIARKTVDHVLTESLIAVADTAPPRSPSPVRSQDSPDPDFPFSPVPSHAVPAKIDERLSPLVKPALKKKRAKTVSDEPERPITKKKKKKRDDIDDIFGF